VNAGGTLKTRGVIDRFAAANSTLNINGGTIVSNDTNNDEEWIRDDSGGVTTNILAGGATFDTNGQDNQRITVALGGAGSLTKTGAGTLVLATNNTYAGTTTVDGGTLQLGGNGTTGSIGSGALSLANGTTLAINRSDNHLQSTCVGAGAAFNAGLSGDVGFSKRGNGIFTMDVANTYTGATTVTSGALRVPDLSFLPASSAVSVSTSGTLALTGTTLTRNISVGGTGMTVAHTGTEFLAVQRGALQGASGTSTMNGNITLTEALTRIGIQDGASLVLNGNIIGSATNAVIFRASGTTSGTIDANGTASSYGDTHVYGSTVRIGSDNAFGTGGVLTVGTTGVGTSTLDLHGNDQTVTGLRSDQNNTTGVITNDGATDSQLIIINTVDDWTYNGTIRDGATHKVSLVTGGSFRQTLTGSNTFSGPTSVNGGSLLITGSLPKSQVTVGATGTLLGNGTLGAPLTVAGTVSPGAALATGTLPAGPATITGTYVCEIDGASKDVLDVLGDLDITGTTLAITILAGGFTESEYVIAVYSGTLIGTFASVTPGYAVDYSTPGEIKLTSTADPYELWAETNGVEAVTVDTDSDGDGISNGIEFVLGGDPSGPNSNSNGLLPTVTADASHLIFTFRRTDASTAFAPYVQYGSSLSNWTPAVHNAPVESPVSITTENDAIEAGIDRVTVKIPRALANGNRVFARLAVDID
jgi:autotransporter-associated beta strand protein